MNVVSYRHYLDLLENKPGSPLFQKVLVFVLIVALIGIGTISAAFYKYRKEVPIRAQYQYLQSTNTDFESSKQSLKEVLSSFRVAGDKVSIVDSLQNEPNPSSGFFVALDDLEKNLSKIEATNVNVQTKKINTEGNVVPSKLVDLNNQILDFYSQSSQIMSDLYKDHLFAKEMLLASGPKFYLPVLTDEKLWEKATRKKF